MLFADIKGFTEYSHSTNPEGVVNMLRNLFTDMDKMCLKFNVYKVYTIGDCYVVMGFTNSAKRNVLFILYIQAYLRSHQYYQDGFFYDRNYIRS